MRNCLILGCGRSGTSALAGILSHTSYFMGDNLYPPDRGNLKGYFEDVEINAINEKLLEPFSPLKPPGRLGQLFFKHRLPRGARWLARLPLGSVIKTDPGLVNRIKKIVSREPYCLKDPRFSYTLSAWAPFLENAVFLCVFRRPEVTAFSILKECCRDGNLREIGLTLEEAIEIWTLMYRHILEIHYRKHEKWFFIHYHQVADSHILQQLSLFLSATVNPDFFDRSLERTKGKGEINLPTETASVYQKLCRYANYRE